MWSEAKPGVTDTQPLSARHNDKGHAQTKKKIQVSKQKYCQNRSDSTTVVKTAATNEAVPVYTSTDDLQNSRPFLVTVEDVGRFRRV